MREIHFDVDIIPKLKYKRYQRPDGIEVSIVTGGYFEVYIRAAGASTRLVFTARDVYYNRAAVISTIQTALNGLAVAIAARIAENMAACFYKGVDFSEGEKPYQGPAVGDYDSVKGKWKIVPPDKHEFEDWD